MDLCFGSAHPQRTHSRPPAQVIAGKFFQHCAQLTGTHWLIRREWIHVREVLKRQELKQTVGQKRYLIKAQYNAVFHLPRKVEVGAGNDATPEFSSAPVRLP